MPERHGGYVVVLEDDMRDDDAEATLNALRMVKGVLSVTAVVADQAPAWIIEDRVRSKVRARLYHLAAEI